MDTRSLHIIFNQKLSAVAWDMHGEHEYVLVGDGLSIDSARLQELIDATFQSSPLCFSFGRRTAVSVPREEAAAWISQRAHLKQSTTVADQDLCVFLQVNAIGVARTGATQANNSFKPNPLRGSA